MLEGMSRGVQNIDFLFDLVLNAFHLPGIVIVAIDGSGDLRRKLKAS